MLGTLGTSEMVFIFLLALVLFGPKKLPEIGRTIGRAITEFRKASSELKSTFDREVRALEQEAKLSEVTNQFQSDTYNYDYSSYESTYEGAYGDNYDSNGIDTSTASASATQDAESPSAAGPDGVIARGSETEPLLIEAPVEGHSSTTANTTASETAPAEQNV